MLQIWVGESVAKESQSSIMDCSVLNYKGIQVTIRPLYEKWKRKADSIMTDAVVQREVVGALWFNKIPYKVSKTFINMRHLLHFQFQYVRNKNCQNRKYNVVITIIGQPLIKNMTRQLLLNIQLNRQTDIPNK